MGCLPVTFTLQVANNLVYTPTRKLMEREDDSLFKEEETGAPAGQGH